MMKSAAIVTRWACIAVLGAAILSLPGCTRKPFTIRIEGLLVAGAEQLPIADAEITLFASETDFVTTRSDKDGKWVLSHEFSWTEFDYDDDGIRRLSQTSDYAYQMRVVAGEKTFIVPVPAFAEPKDGLHGEVFVFAAVDIAELNPS